MDINEIREIIKLIDSSSITEFVMEKENFKISIKKEQPVIRSSDNEPAAYSREKTAERKIESNESAIDIKQDESNMVFIKSPIVGTFYSSPDPDAAPYVSKGTKIEKGDVLCIIEAMKLMNEVTSDVDGEIVEVLVSNGSIVEYGQPLFKVRQV